jgi:hypothetical protein
MHPVCFVKKAGVLCAMLLGYLSISLPCRAQSSVDGAIGGTVTDPSDKVIPGASVSTLNVATNGKATATTDEVGRYVIIHLQPGTYTVEVVIQGFSAYKQENVIVEVGRTSTVDAKLGLAAQTETVIATAEAPVITTDRPDLTTNINDVEMNNLPVNKRRWSTFALTAPGAAPDGNFGLISFRGISGLLNNNTVDGGDNNQAFFAEEKGRTRISYSISEASIREFQVNTSNYSAEYGRSAGGVVNAVTKSGTNRIHGEAFWFLRSSDFSATNPFATLVNPPPAPSTPIPVKPPDKRHQFGGSLGGPIIKDKLFWFFSADQQFRNFPAVANASNPGQFFLGLSAAELTTLSGRGITAAQGNAGLAFLQTLTGIVPRKGDELLLFPKIDWQISSNHHFSGEYNRMRWDSPGGIQATGAVIFRGKESFGDDFVKDDTGIARLTSTLTPTVINEFRFQYGRDFEFETGQPSIPGEPVSQQGVSAAVVISGSAGITFGKPNFLNRPQYPNEHNYEFADTVSWSRGKHLFKFGEDINRVHDLLGNLFRESGEFSYNNRVDYISDYVAFTNNFAQPACTTPPPPPITHIPCYSQFNQGFGPPSFNFTTVDYGFFFQDDWRIRPRLTLNLGLRWDYEQMPSPQIPNTLLPASSQFPSDKNNFGPRLGFAWDLTGRGKSVIRGGYGIYYGRIINSTIYNAIGNTGLTGKSQLSFQFAPTTGGPLYPLVASAPSTILPDVVVFGPDTPNPMIHEFDFAFEQQIATNTAISVSYMGSLGRNLPFFIDENLPAPTGTVTYTVSSGPENGQSFTVPEFIGPKGATLRPNGNFGRITTILDAVHSTYNAVVVQFNRRMTKGLQVQASYIYSHASDNDQTSQTQTSPNNVLNPFNLGLEQARSTFDIRQRFGTAIIWQPQYFENKGTLVRMLLGGFLISPAVSVASGAPYTGTVSGNAPNPSNTIIAVSSGILGAGGTSRPPWIPRNAFTMPRTANVDLRIAKKFPLYEKVTLELSGDAYNLFNHVNATSVGTRIYSISGTLSNAVLTYDPSFGVVTSSTSFFGNERQIQIGAKLTF